jgi:uncharacterized protein DUF3883
MRQSHQTASELALREKQIVAGLFLSKFDKTGLKALGFSNFNEAFNAIGFALGAKPASIKNYRDEFDPVFSSRRKGWHKRPMRGYCRDINEKYESLSLGDFATRLKSLVYEGGEVEVLAERAEDDAAREASFAKRLVTGQAAERYFEMVHPTLPVLAEYSLENVTKSGCGFDYKLNRRGAGAFLAVEVKGLNERRGSIAMTEKEHRVASLLCDRFFLFVVRNFRENPFHDIYRNPINSTLSFSQQETKVVQVSWRVMI